MAQSVGIIGAGAWGTAIAKVIAEKGHGVHLWSYEDEVARQIRHQHRNDRYLVGVRLPEGIVATTDLLHAVSDRDFLLIATPSLYTVDTVKRMLPAANIVEGTTLIGVLTKGLVASPRGPRLITDALEDYLPGSYKGNLAYLSGPSHAEEVARGKLTGLISACPNAKNSIRFRELLSTRRLIVFSSLDVVGVQTCAAVKNVIAVAFGMLDALKELFESFGDNTESLLLAAGLNEIQTLGRAIGASHPETFTSIAGVGDLDVTCRSRFGRNRRFGREIILDRVLARFRDLDDLIEHIDTLGYFPEGAVACRHTEELARRHRLKLPISRAVHRILNREIEAVEALEELVAGLAGGVPDPAALPGDGSGPEGLEEP
jgi:glycerol-3-phosphate dehydrogenase (NAD(P)+)